jgi:hypothetical protein
MSDETQLPEDIEFPTPPLRPDQPADPVESGLTWLCQGYLAQQKVTGVPLSRPDAAPGRRRGVGRRERRRRRPDW